MSMKKSKKAAPAKTEEAPVAIEVVATAKAAPAGPEKKTISSDSGALYILLGAALLAVVVSCTVIYITVVQAANRAHIDLSAARYAEVQAQSINQNLARIAARMKKVGTRPSLAGAVQNLEMAQGAILSQQLQDEGVFTTRVILIPKGHAGDYQLSFSEIDMVRRVESGEEVPAEAFENKEDKNWYINMASGIFDQAGAMPVGTLLMTYNVGVLSASTDPVDAARGMTRLYQQFPNTKTGRDVLVAGQAGDSAVPTVPIALSNKIWFVTFTPSSQLMAETVADVRMMAVGGAVAFALLLLGILVVHRRVGRTVTIEKTIAIRGSSREEVKADARSAKATKAEQAPAVAADDFEDPLFHESGLVVEEMNEDSDTAVSMLQAMKLKSSRKATQVNPAIFRDYDIRGHAAMDFEDNVVYAIGRAIGSEVCDQGGDSLILGADGRTSTSGIREQLIQGICDAGCNIVDIGEAPTPVVYFAVATGDVKSAVMITASHNPASDNGFKIVIGGTTLSGDGIQALRARIESEKFTSGKGEVSTREVVAEYVDRIASDVVLAGSPRVVIDCGNGIAGTLAPTVLAELGCDVIPLFCDVDGAFPNHDPDPSVLSNLDALIAKVQETGADVGIALDGDGDRIAVVSATGEIILPDRLLMLFAKDIVSRNPGSDVIFDVKSTRRLAALVSSYGGRPVMCKSGHSHIKNKMQETGALIGGELSGHIFFRERWFGFDDGIYAAVRLLELMTIRDQGIDEIFAAFPRIAATPDIRVFVPDDKKFALMDKIIKNAKFENAKIIDIDGLRAEFPKGWGLVRASNTSAAITFRFEADDEPSMEKIKDMFKQELAKIDSTLVLDF